MLMTCEAIKETENLNEGKVFLVKELFKGYVWNIRGFCEERRFSNEYEYLYY